MQSLAAKVILATLMLSAPFMSAAAQNFQGGVHFALGVPQADFKSKIGRNGYGLSGHIGFAPASVPVMLGVELGFLVYGNETRREPFSGTIPDVTVDVTTTNTIGLAHLTMRLQPNSGVIRPYIDGLVGVNYLTTATEIQNRGRGGEEIASSTNFDDAAFSYGGGGGIMFRVHQSDDQEGGGIKEVLIDLRGRYLVGGEAEYLKEGSIRRENGRVTYDVQKSKTDLITVQLGVALRF